VETLSKLVDAASMFWQSLDERERMVVAYGAAWLVLVLVAGAAQRQRERLKAELLEELTADGGRSRV